MAMKRILLILSFLAMSFLQVHAQTRYLVNVLSPVDSYAYRAYKYTGGNSPAMNLAGGLDWLPALPSEVPSHLMCRGMPASVSGESMNP